MKRIATMLLLSATLAFADATPVVKDEPFPLRTWVIAAAHLLSPLFAGWALAKNRSKKPLK